MRRYSAKEFWPPYIERLPCLKKKLVTTAAMSSIHLRSILIFETGVIHRQLVSPTGVVRVNSNRKLPSC